MRKKTKITKEDLIRNIAKCTKSSISDVRKFYSSLEEFIFDSLHNVNENKEVCIKLFEGISLDGIYMPEKTKTNNLNGQIEIVHSKIKPKFNITRSYREKLNK